MKWGVRKDQEYAAKRRDKHISTDEGDTTIDFFEDKAYQTVSNKVDAQTFSWNEKMINTIEETLPDRYASEEEAQKKFDELPKYNTSKKITQEEQIFNTNHNSSTAMREVNCYECGMAYELRQRGYDVQAKEMHGGWAFEASHAFDVKDAFKITTTPKDAGSSDKESLAKECYKQLEAQCLSYGEGARGILGIQYYIADSGHCMNWQVKNGKFEIINSQSADYNGYDIFMYADAEKGVSVYRLDNAEVLPGVTDFVEPFAYTEEELEEQKKKKLEALRPKKEADEKMIAIEAEKKRADEAARIAAEKEAGKSAIEKFFDGVIKVAKDIIDKGKEIVSSIFNVQEVAYINGERVDTTKKK